jgi:hypothetical protein
MLARCRDIHLLILMLWATSCASTPPVVKRGTLPPRAEIGVISFRDCVIAGQEDCGGSGNIAGSIFARVFSATARFKAVPLSRPVGPTEALTDDAAAAYAKQRGLEYVINGEVDEYYSVAPFTFRSDRAGISMRVLRASDSSVVAFYSQRKEAGSNLGTPDRIIEKIAERIRDALN